MRYRFEVGAHVVPREIEHIAVPGTVISRHLCDNHRLKTYVIRVSERDYELVVACHEDELVRKTDA